MSRSMPTFISAVIVWASFVLVHLCVTLTAPVDAFTFKARSCSRQVATNDQQSTALGWTEYWRGSFETVGWCPDGLSFDTGSPSSYGDYGYWFVYSPGRLPIEHATLTVEGGDTSSGIRYSVGGCVSTGCTEIDQSLERSAEDGAATIELGPFAGPMLAIRAECVDLVCGSSRPLKIHDVVLTLRDDRPPRVASAAGISPGWMRRRSFDARFTLEDFPGVGMGWATAVFDESVPVSTRIGCSMTEPIATPGFYSLSSPCSTSSVYVRPVPSVSTLVDGEHTITVRAADAAGNETAPQTHRIRLDDTPPERPENPTVSDSPDGWTSRDLVTVAWSNPGETWQTDRESGIKFTYHLLVPHGGEPIETNAVRTSAYEIYPDRIPNLRLPVDGLWDLRVWTEDAVGNQSPPMTLTLGRDRDVPAPPVLHANPWLGRNDLVHGYRQEWVSPSQAELESGICGYAIRINSREQSDPPPEITDRGKISTYAVPAVLPRGENWFHIRAVSCAGLVSETATVPLRVDDQRPEVVLHGPTGPGWLKGPADITVEGSDEGSGVATVEYSVDGGPARTTNGKLAKVDVAGGIREISFWATDVAGNRSVVRSRVVSVDAVAPNATFLRRDPARPAFVTATVDDRDSGIAQAQIQHRRLDAEGSEWRGLPTIAQDEPTGATGQRLSATIPDDELDSGEYALRIVATDRVGNTSASDSVVNSGEPMRLRLPLRAPTQVSAAIALRRTRCVASGRRACPRGACAENSKSSCRSLGYFDVAGATNSRTTAFGARVAIAGELHDAAGAPVANRSLDVYSETMTAAGPRGRLKIGETVTDSSGDFVFALPTGPNRRFTVASAATDTLLPTGTHADLGVTAGVRLRADSRAVRSGRPIRFTGQLLGLDGSDAPGRLSVTMDFWNAGYWQNGIQRTKTNADGRFRMSYIPTRRPGAARRLRVRAVVSAERTGWPYQDGASNVVEIRIKR